MNGRGGGRRSKSHRAQLSPRRAIGVNIRGDMVGALSDLESAVLNRVLRPGAYAGATVFYDEVKRNVPVDEGLLRDSVYRYHDNAKSRPGVEVFAIGPNKRKAPHWHLIEYGHWLVNRVYKGQDGKWIGTRQRRAVPKWIPPQPYLRPAFSGKVRASIKAMRDRMRQMLDEVKSEIRP